MYAYGLQCQQKILVGSYIYCSLFSQQISKIISYELWYGHKPNLSNQKVFGCNAYSYVLAKHRSKFESTSKKDCIFMGYCQDPNTYKLWDNTNNKFFHSRNLIFNEKLEGYSQSTILPISLAPLAESAPHSDNSNASDDNVADQNADKIMIQMMLLSHQHKPLVRLGKCLLHRHKSINHKKK